MITLRFVLTILSALVIFPTSMFSFSKLANNEFQWFFFSKHEGNSNTFKIVFYLKLYIIGTLNHLNLLSNYMGKLMQECCAQLGITSHNESLRF